MLELSRTSGRRGLQRRRNRYLCPKCLAVHEEYYRVMAIIDQDMEALRNERIQGRGDEDGPAV